MRSSQAISLVENVPPNSLIKVLVPVVKYLLSRVEKEGFQLYLLAESLVLAHKLSLDVFDKFDISQFGTLRQYEIMPLLPNGMKISFSGTVGSFQFNFSDELGTESDVAIALLPPVSIDRSQEYLTQDENGDQDHVFDADMNFLDVHDDVSETSVGPWLVPPQDIFGLRTVQK